MVYVLQAGPFYKIGWSEKPERRLKQVQTGNPYKVRIFCVIKTLSKGNEAMIQSLFEDKKTEAGNEWFRLCNDDLKKIKAKKREIERVYKYNLKREIFRKKNGYEIKRVVLNEWDYSELNQQHLKYLNGESVDYDFIKYLVLKKEGEWINGEIYFGPFDQELRFFYQDMKDAYYQVQKKK